MRGVKETLQNDISSCRVRAVERIMLSLPHELLTKLTELAQDKGLSRASYIRMVLTERVNDELRERES